MRTVSIHVSANVTQDERKALRALALTRGKSARELAGEAVRIFLKNAGALKARRKEKNLEQKNGRRELTLK